MGRRHLSIKTRVSIWYAVLIVAIIAAVTLVITYVTNNTIIENARSGLTDTVDRAVDDISLADGKLNEEVMSSDDRLFQDLWRTYFKAICIRERINPRKQLSDMPRRYWKYLTEKQ